MFSTTESGIVAGPLLEGLLITLRISLISLTEDGRRYLNIPLNVPAALEDIAALKAGASDAQPAQASPPRSLH